MLVIRLLYAFLITDSYIVVVYVSFLGYLYPHADFCTFVLSKLDWPVMTTGYPMFCTHIVLLHLLFATSNSSNPQRTPSLFLVKSRFLLKKSGT